jgi:hypothetical protein
MKLARCSESASLTCSEPVLAGVADDVHADLRRGAFLGDLAQPHPVRAAHPVSDQKSVLPGLNRNFTPSSL